MRYLALVLASACSQVSGNESMDPGEGPGDRNDEIAPPRYHVAPHGNDDGTGTAEDPFRTIQYAVSVAGAGDRILVHAGSYFERVDIPTSGITVDGERGPNGERLAIVDSSDPTSGWVPAPERGWGVWKTTSIPYAACALSAGGKTIWKLDLAHNDWAFHEPPGVYGESYWDGVEAMFANDIASGETYVRFRNGDDPNQLDVRAAPDDDYNVCNSVAPKRATFAIWDRSDVMIRGLVIRGGAAGVIISTRDGSADHNVVDDNHISNGYTRVALYGNVNHNQIRNNRIEMNHIATTATFHPGAFNYADDPYPHYTLSELRSHQYMQSRTHGGTWNVNISLGFYGAVGTGNEIHGNHVRESMWGINSYSDEDMAGTRIYNNRFEQLALGVAVGWDYKDLQIYGNTFEDIFLPIRGQSIEVGEIELYIYNNRFYNPPAIGKGIWFMSYPCVPGDTGYSASSFCGPGLYPQPGDSRASVFIYHNTLINGSIDTGWGVDGFGTPRVHVINNVMTSQPGLVAFRADSQWGDFCNVRERIGAVDYNAIYGDVDCTGAPWFGGGNVIASSALLDNTAPMFTLPAGSVAREAGVDVSQPFVASGRSLPALPGYSPGYFAGAAPDIGAL